MIETVLLFSIAILIAIVIVAIPDLALYLFIALIPFQSFMVSDSSTIARYASLLALVSFFIHNILIQRKRIKIDITLTIMLIFNGIVVLSILWSVNTDASILYLSLYLSATVIYFLLINVIDNMKKFDRLMRVMLFSALLFGLIGIMEQQDMVTGGSFERLGAAALNANTYFVVAICFSPPIYWTLSRSKNLFMRACAILVAGLLLYTSLFTYSRGGLISLFVVFLSFFLLNKYKGKTILPIILIVVFIAINIPEQFVERFVERLSSPDYVDRFTDLWPVSITAISKSPIWGYGAGTNQIIMTKYLPFLRGKAISPHNAFLAVLMDLGLIGLFFYLTFILVPNIKLFQRIRAINNASFLYYFSLFLFSVFLGYLFSMAKWGGGEVKKYLWLLLGLETCIVSISSHLTNTFNVHGKIANGKG